MASFNYGQSQLPSKSSELLKSTDKLILDNSVSGKKFEDSQVMVARQYQDEFLRTRKAAIDANTKQITVVEQKELDVIVEKMEAEVPASAEFHYVKYVNSNYDVTKVDHLHKAYELSNNKVELYDDYIAYYELTHNEAKKTEFCSKLYKSKSIPSGIMDYNYNVLMSLEKNAIIFVNGFDDTYPIWMHQHVKGIRKDVTILNVDLLGVDAYRNNKMKSLGVTSNVNYNIDRVGFIKSIAKENPTKPIYFALTLNQIAIKEVKEHLYLTGLALKYSPKPMDNIPVLEKNWENSFRVASLDQTHSNSTVKKMNNNYILPLMLLSMNYKTQGNTEQSV
ncbi:MAG: hypothetical protein JKY54_15960 [Flavobacteriales bacterium]|nr:hypothetical protein [Flavobacteriales bacterium]